MRRRSRLGWFGAALALPVAGWLAVASPVLAAGSSSPVPTPASSPATAGPCLLNCSAASPVPGGSPTPIRASGPPTSRATPTSLASPASPASPATVTSYQPAGAGYQPVGATATPVAAAATAAGTSSPLPNVSIGSVSGTLAPPTTPTPPKPSYVRTRTPTSASGDPLVRDFFLVIAAAIVLGIGGIVGLLVTRDPAKRERKRARKQAGKQANRGARGHRRN